MRSFVSLFLEFVHKNERFAIVFILSDCFWIQSLKESIKIRKFAQKGNASHHLDYELFFSIMRQTHL